MNPIRDRMEVVAFHFSNQFERMQVHISSFLHSANHKLAILYGNSIIWVDELDVQEKLGETWASFMSKFDEVIDALRNNTLHLDIAQHISDARAFFRNEVSKQAVYFGFAGLITGGVIGLCIGYTVTRQSIFSSQYFPSPANGSATTLMKAVFSSCTRRGVDGITLATIPVPRHLASDELLIQVKAIGLDNIDARIACGYRHSLRRHVGLPAITEPFLLGRECSGIVVEVGKCVSTFEVNDQVWVLVPIWASQGLMAEYIVLSHRFAARKPRNISFEGAATLPYAAFILFGEILPKAHLGPLTARSKRVLIHLGITSKNDGVGLLLTQVLKVWGARVTISTHENSTSEHLSNSSSFGVAQRTFLHTLKSLGAESHIILPNDESLLPDLTQRIFDAVVNTDSAQATPVLQNFVKDAEGSVIETFPPDFESKSCGLLSRIYSTYKLLFRQRPEEEKCEERLEECRRMVESGSIVPVVGRSFLLSQYDQAFHHVSTSSHSTLAQAHVGKSVLVFKASTL